MVTIHGTAVGLGGVAVLLRGPSGSGKSDLALRLIDGGALLVADDRVALVADGGRLMAAPPAELAGLLEVRGVGIKRLEHQAPLPVGLVVDLVWPERVERLPEPATARYQDIYVRLLALAPFEASTAAKIRLALA